MDQVGEEMSNTPQSDRPQRTSLGILAVVGIVVIIGAVVALTFSLRLGRGTPSFSTFVDHNSTYQAELAEACEMLFEKTPSDSVRERDFQRDDESLPLAIQSLQPRAVHVAKNLLYQNDTNLHSHVLIHVGSGLGGFSVVWSPENGMSQDPTWVLSANQQNLSKILFKTNKIDTSK